MPELLLIALLINLLLITTVRLFPLSPAPRSKTRTRRIYQGREGEDYDGYE